MRYEIVALFGDASVNAATTMSVSITDVPHKEDGSSWKGVGNFEVKISAYVISILVAAHSIPRRAKKTTSQKT